MRKNMRYAHFAKICEKCGKVPNMRQSHIRVFLTCLYCAKSRIMPGMFMRCPRGFLRSTLFRNLRSMVECCETGVGTGVCRASSGLVHYNCTPPPPAYTVNGPSSLLISLKVLIADLYVSLLIAGLGIGVSLGSYISESFFQV